MLEYFDDLLKIATMNPTLDHGFIATHGLYSQIR